MARKQRNIHYIYKTTCNVTGRWYVGMHSAYKLDDGYMGSGKRLRHSIRKHGVENHTKEILEFLPTREELVLREIEIVTKELICDDLCMNLKEGGQGGFINKEHQKKAQISSRVSFIEHMKNDIEFGEKIKKILTENTKNAHKKGKIPYGISFKDKTHSDKTKKLMSEKKKGNGIGIKNSQFGTCWITNEIDNKKIFKGSEIPEGWRLGRKLK
jgi:hypothetical protein